MLLASSGIHANGISLARKLAERLPEGYRTRLADGRTFGEALLDPTVLYAPVTEHCSPPACVRTTPSTSRATAGASCMRHPAELRYMIRSVPPVPPVLEFLQAQGGMSARDAYGTLQHGRGLRAVRGARGRRRDDRRRRRAPGSRHGMPATSHAGAKSLVIEPLGLEYAARELHLRG